MALTLTSNLLRYLAYIIAILKLAHIRVRDSVWATIIAINTSVTAAVVNYARTNNTAGEGLFRITSKRDVRFITVPQRDQDVERLVAQHAWRTAIKHKWRAVPYQVCDINILDATAANMALEWSTKSCPPISMVVMISDSTATIVAFAKEMSSKPPMIAQYHRQAGLQLAAGLTVVLLHVRSTLNPADDSTR